MGRRTGWPQPLADGRGCRLPYDTVAAAWADYFGRVPWTVMVTLTFDPRLVFPVRLDRAEKETEDWCRLVAYAVRRPIGWLFALERHNSGSWHTHVLIADVKTIELEAPIHVWKTRNGKMTDVREVSVVHGAVQYVCKEAAAAGNVIVSDTLVHFKDRLRPEVVIQLIPQAERRLDTVTVGEMIGTDNLAVRRDLGGPGDREHADSSKNASESARALLAGPPSAPRQCENCSKPLTGFDGGVRTPTYTITGLLLVEDFHTDASDDSTRSQDRSKIAMRSEVMVNF